MPSAVPPLEVSAEEREALLESGREALGEAGYQKLRAAIRTLSYVTELLENREANGARIGDLFMSLIHTCELSGANPFDYLTQLLRHAGELARNPWQWMPWNYRATVEATGARLDSG